MLDATKLKNEVMAEINKVKVSTPTGGSYNDKNEFTQSTEQKPDMSVEAVINATCIAVVKHIQDNLELAASLTFAPSAVPGPSPLDAMSITPLAPLVGVGGGVPGPVTIPPVPIKIATGTMTVTVPKGKFS